MPQTALPRSVKSAVQPLLTFFHKDARAIPGSATFGNTRIDACITAINSALLEIHTLGPAWTYRKDQGIAVNAPVDSSAWTFTKDSTTFTPNASDWQDWMEGCTVKINNESSDNRIIAYDPVALTGTLREAYTGTTGTQSVTVWHDSVLLPDDVAEIMLPVFWGNKYQLHAATGYGEATWATSDAQFYEDFGAGNKRIYKGGSRPDLLLSSSRPGDPRLYWIENWWDGNHEQQKRMFLAPLPSAADRILYSCKLEIPQYVTTDVLHTSDGPIPLVAAAGDTALAPIATAAGDTSLDAFPLSSFGPNAVASETFPINTTPPAEREVTLDISSLTTSLVTGQRYLAWYVVQAAGTCVEGTILKFPYDLVDAVLMKVAAQHLRESPFFRNDAVLPEIERGYRKAMETMVAAKPQNKSPVHMTARY